MSVTKDSLIRFFAKRNIRIEQVEDIGGNFIVGCDKPQEASRIWVQTSEPTHVSFYSTVPSIWVRLLRRIRGK